MRIAFLTWSSRVVGGAERYISVAVEELRARGHEVAVCHELDEPADRARLAPGEVPSWCVADLGRERALRELRSWRPDVIYTHLVNDVELEAAAQRIAPAVLFAHGYLGACISGAKSHKFPSVVPCGRRFGAGCLVHYFPRRCGGLSPLTMVRDFRVQTERKRLLEGYAAIATNSTHMQAEYARYVDDPSRVHRIPLPVSDPGVERSEAEVEARLAARDPGEPWRLLFVGRMDHLKGGEVLLEALPAAAGALGPLEMVFVGDGPARGDWERAAGSLDAAQPSLSVRFTGWLSGAALAREWDDADLLVVPSLWPEPFGLVGPEAGLRGIPAAAFAVGGIPDWLRDGESGALAPADPPSARGLTEAIVRCLRDPDHYASLCRGALAVARNYHRDPHFAALTELLESAARPGREKILNA